MGCEIEPRNAYVAGAEAVKGAEGNMCGAAMRGPVALPGSEATSRKKGTRRNLGDLVWPAVACAIPGRDRKPRRRSCRGTGEESDGSIVLEKPSNKAVRSGGGEGGGKGPSRRKRSMLKHAPDTAPASAVTRGADPRIEPKWAFQAPNVDHVRPPTRARCGQAARRDLRGRCQVTGTSTRQAADPQPGAVEVELGPCCKLRIGLREGPD